MSKISFKRQHILFSFKLLWSINEEFISINSQRLWTKNHWILHISPDKYPENDAYELDITELDHTFYQLLIIEEVKGVWNKKPQRARL